MVDKLAESWALKAVVETAVVMEFAMAHQLDKFLVVM